MLGVVDCQEELEVVFVGASTIFRAAIRQNTQDWQVVLLVEGSPLSLGRPAAVMQSLAWATLQ
jgi:hypothetical protein